MSIWDDLSHSQRCVIAKEIGQLIQILLSVESPVAGTIAIASDSSSISAEMPNIVPFILTDTQGDPIRKADPNGTEDERDARPCDTTLELYEYYLSQWKEAALAESLGGVNSEIELYNDMLKVVREMHDLGLFKPDINCLCHLDLHPRNIMVEIESEDSI